MPNPRCPGCRGTHTYRTSDEPSDHTWRCQDCPVEFEPDDEGGDYSNDPTRRIERQEERAADLKRKRQAKRKWTQ